VTGGVQRTNGGSGSRPSPGGKLGLLVVAWGALVAASCNSVWGIGDLRYEDVPTGGQGGVGGSSSGVGGSASSSSSSGIGGTGGEGLGSVGGGGSGGSSSGAGGSGGSGGTVANLIGCSDGTREAYTDPTSEPDIAGCDGGFDVPGVTSNASQQPTCNRQAGDDSTNPDGTGCSVADLCALGWHVCTGSADVAQSASNGQCPPSGPGKAFWITRQAQLSGTFNCAAPGDDNLLGCGSGVGMPPATNCQPLNSQVAWLSCATLDAWDCSSQIFAEALHVTKPLPTEGGALCCRD